MLWADLYEAFAHADGHSLMGRKLRPFCAYHHFWLKLIDSPLMRGGAASIADFDTASRICSADFGGAPDAVRPPRLPRLYYGWRMLRWDKHKLDAAFRAYVEDYASPPTRWGAANRKTIGQRRESFPYSIHLVTALMMHGNMGRREAWMLPLGEAEWYLAGFELNRGEDPRLVDAHDQEYMAAMKQQKAAKEGEIDQPEEAAP